MSDDDNKSNNNFIKAVAAYFMDFLETDFHKRRKPRRAINLRNPDNLLVGINLDKYPTFNNKIWEVIGKNFDGIDSLNIAKGGYRADTPKNLIDLIALQTKKIQQKKLNLVIAAITEAIEKNATLYKDEFNKAFEDSKTTAYKQIEKELVQPFISSIEKSLLELSLADENTIYLMTDELASVFLSNTESVIADAIKLIVSGEKSNTKKSLDQVLNVASVSEIIDAFFSDLKTNDLFQEVYEINRNKQILDKQEFYLYFCNITYNQAKYPIFYIPLNIEEQNDTLTINFDSQLYINKKSIEYIAQEFNETTGKKGTLQGINDRIIYLSQHKEDLAEHVGIILNELTNFFDLDQQLDISNPEKQIARGSKCRITNETNLTLFDKSDEALINDYEEILALEEGSELFDNFDEIIDGFINANPISVTDEVDTVWDELDTSNKLVSENPIPLNSEQRKILLALNNDKCNYILVEGPPGTGKSHTITAIAFNAVLENKSVLILSDKKEALDVVEDKFANTMNTVRFDQNFQNPILRLGKSGNNYRQILQAGSVDRIRTNYKVVKNKFDGLEENIEKSILGLREDLVADVLISQNIEVKELIEFIQLEEYVKSNIKYVDLLELNGIQNSYLDIEELKNAISRLNTVLDANSNLNQFTKVIGASLENNAQFQHIEDVVSEASVTVEALNGLSEVVSEEEITTIRDTFNTISSTDLPKLSEYIQKYQSYKKAIVGFRFNKAKVESLDIDFINTFSCKFSSPHQNLDSLVTVLNSLRQIEEYGKQLKLNKLNEIDFVSLSVSFKPHDAEPVVESLQQISKDISFIKNVISKYPSTSEKLKLNKDSFQPSNTPIQLVGEVEFDKLLRYLSLSQKISKQFNSFPDYNFRDQQKDIEKLVTEKMTYLMDERLVKFANDNKNDLQTLKDIIKSKEKFPKELFTALKEAFPCILSGIRDYAEYIPLAPDIFDLIIIDEASQVSIAQAFPALLRAKKVLILGDKLQFGNVKSAQAKSDVNQEYLNRVKDVFEKNVSNESSKLQKLAYFDVKKSILDFFGFINNYQTMLKKHFRGYKENISLSNKYFYQNALEVMKIRGKSIDDVIKIEVLPEKENTETNKIPNTNIQEIEFIITKLNELKDENSNSSVGIITPHTNQQNLLSEIISTSPNRDFFYDNLHLKIMTFDTCQGEERDIIFYSMVATKEDDKLQYIFSKDLSLKSLDDDDEESIRKQRLNVGLSRSKECMYFVLSKEPSEYVGAAREALLHYQQAIEDAAKEKSVDSVDQKSPMEPKVLNWFYQTEFWNKNKDRSYFETQFELGKYLKQLDPTYNHPNYEVDFLLIYTDESSQEHKIVLEYDGFYEHFQNPENVNKYNFENYYSEADIYRQKILEGYGYHFIRINKFNIGDSPVATLDERIAQTINPSRAKNTFLEDINNTIKGIHNKELKECVRCNEPKPIEEFDDPTLASGKGKICKTCKASGISISEKSQVSCPQCSASMVLREGRYGRFYGCSRYPYCKGTLTVKQASVMIQKDDPSLCPKCGSAMIMLNDMNGEAIMVCKDQNGCDGKRSV